MEDVIYQEDNAMCKSQTTIHIYRSKRQESEKIGGINRGSYKSPRKVQRCGVWDVMYLGIVARAARCGQKSFEWTTWGTCKVCGVVVHCILHCRQRSKRYSSGSQVNPRLAANRKGCRSLAALVNRHRPREWPRFSIQLDIQDRGRYTVVS